MGLTGLTLLLGLLAVVMVLMVVKLLNTGKIIRLVGPDVLEVFVKVLGVVPAAI
jgi:small neutral amino acid transporter SnatA (MarC family)